MANPEHLKILKQGVEAWNKWRKDNPKVIPYLKGADLQRADLQRADLQRADLKEAKLKEANLQGADLRRADLKWADLKGADLKGADLKGADLKGAGLFWANLQWAGLVWANLQGAVLREANLQGAILRGARLRGADLKEANLQGADLEGARLQGAELQGAKLQQANLKDTIVTGVRFDDAMRCSAINVQGCSGSQRFVRHVMDLDYIEETKEKHPAKYWIWKCTSNCGRSIGLWACISVALALLFGVAFARYPVWSLLPEWLQSFFVSIAPSFNYNNSGVEGTWFTPYYFSIVTFTTLGFGDVTPIDTAGQLWLAAEVILGYIMLGGLITLFATRMVRQSG